MPFYSRKKKRKRKSRERKTKKGPDVSTSLFAFSPLLSSQLMFFFSRFFFFCFVSFLFCSFSFFCHFLLAFNLLFVKINKKTLKKKKKSIETYYQKFADDDKCNKRSLKTRQHRRESRNKNGKMKYAIKLGILTFSSSLYECSKWFAC